MFRRPAVAILVIALGASGCSPSRMTADLAGRALSGGGGAYASDDDPQLVREALPFAIKTMEGLIEASPDNAQLRLSAAKSTAAYAHLLGELDETGREGGARRSRLFLRARDHALAGLEARHGGFKDQLRGDRVAALARADADDAAILYWAGAAWAAALSVDKSNLRLVADLPAAGALVARALELDEAVEGGGAAEFLISYEAGRPNGSLDEAERRYHEALRLTDGQSAGAHVAFAGSVAVARQDRTAFRDALAAALAIDPDAAPSRRLSNTLAQRSAKRLLEREEELFIEPMEATS